MLIKKDKKSLFFISDKAFSNSLFNNKNFSTILKLLGILQIFLLIFAFYISIAYDKDQIKELLYKTAWKTYWFGKTLKSLPIKWSNNISSKHPMLKLEIAPKNYQLLMTLRDDAIKTGVNLEEHKIKISAVMNYKNDKFNTQIRLKGDGVLQHLDNPKWSMRVEVNNNRFMGMKAFNLQHPKQRSYMASFMLHKFTENENLITKNFNLIPVAINGKYMGIYNYEEIPDHNMNQFLTGINNIVIFMDDDIVWREIYNSKSIDVVFQHNNEKNYYNSIIKAHSFNEVLNDKILKKDFERASKLLNGFRNNNLSASKVFDLDKVAIWLALTDLFGANHGIGEFNLKFVYDRNSDLLYPILWDAINHNTFSSIAFKINSMFKLGNGNAPIGPADSDKTLLTRARVAPDMFIVQLLNNQNLVEKYLTKLDEVTSSEYIDNVMKIIKPQVDDYMSILQLDYPQFKVEDELKRLKDNAEYLRNIYLYAKIPLNAYLPGDNRQDHLILVNRKPVPIKIIALTDITTGQHFKVKDVDSDFILEKTHAGMAGVPTKVFFECPMDDCFTERKIKNLRISAKTVGTSKNTSIKINNWSAYE